jgi:hypothetical protein
VVEGWAKVTLPLRAAEESWEAEKSLEAEKSGEVTLKLRPAEGWENVDLTLGCFRTLKESQHPPTL